MTTKTLLDLEAQVVAYQVKEKFPDYEQTPIWDAMTNKSTSWDDYVTRSADGTILKGLPDAVREEMTHSLIAGLDVALKEFDLSS